MSTLFYDHLINMDRIRARLAELEIAREEALRLEDEVDKLIQERVVEVVLDVLHEDHRHIFVERLYEDPGSADLLMWLKEQVEDMEERISVAIGELEEELLQEIPN